MPENNAKPKPKRGLHDAYFHYMIKWKSFAVDFLTAYLPNELANQLDLNALTYEDADYYDETLKKYFADVVFSIPYLDKKREPLDLVLMMEHKVQSGNDEDVQTLLQALKYVVQRSVAEVCQRGNRSLKYRQPLYWLIYTGSNPKFEPPTYESVFKTHEARGDEFQIKFKIRCVNLTRLFLNSELKGAPFVHVFVEAMARVSLKAIDGNVDVLLEPLDQVESLNPMEQFWYKALMEYVSQSGAARDVKTEKQMEEKSKLYIPHAESLTEEELENERYFYESMLEIACEKERAKGHEEGLAEGRAKEKETKEEEEYRSIIADIVTLRFGEYPQMMRSKTSKFKSPGLISLVTRASVAKSLKEMEDFANALLASQQS